MGVIKSRDKPGCGYPGCKWNGEYRKMALHMKAKHPGLPLRFKSTAFGVGGKFGSWTSRKGECLLLALISDGWD